MRGNGDANDRRAATGRVAAHRLAALVLAVTLAGCGSDDGRATGEGDAAGERAGAGATAGATAGAGGETRGAGEDIGLASGERADDATAGRPAPSGRIALDERFPAIPVEPLGHHDSLLKAHAWTIAALVPGACGECPDELDDWLLQWEMYRRGHSRFVIVVESRPERADWLEPVTREGSDVRAFTTTSPMFRHTGELDRPSFVVVDTMGVVRYVARQTGTIEERWMSIARNLRYQAAADSTRRAIVRQAFPNAARIELRRTAELDGLAELVALGLSPWFGIAYRDSGDPLGYGLPIERDTECNTCDPLYLIVGMEPRAHVVSIEEVEPVISMGERQLTSPFFAALRGTGSPEDVSRVRQTIPSIKVDRAVREILSVAFVAAARVTKALDDGA